MSLKFVGTKGASQVAGQMNKAPCALLTKNLLLSKSLLVFLNFKTCLGEDNISGTALLESSTKGQV